MLHLVNTAVNPTVDFTQSLMQTVLLLSRRGKRVHNINYRFGIGLFDRTDLWRNSNGNANPTRAISRSPRPNHQRDFRYRPLASLTVSTFSPATTTTSSTLFLRAQTLRARPHRREWRRSHACDGKSSGSAIAIVYAPSPLIRWGSISATLSVPASRRLHSIYMIVAESCCRIRHSLAIARASLFSRSICLLFQPRRIRGSLLARRSLLPPRPNLPFLIGHSPHNAADPLSNISLPSRERRPSAPERRRVNL